MSISKEAIDVDALAQEIRRVDGNHSLGAGALAEALIPFLSTLPIAVEDIETATLKERLRAATVARKAAREALEKGFLNRIPDRVFDAVHEASSFPPNLDAADARSSTLEQKLQVATEALENIQQTRCDHDMGFDREIGPLGCSLGDKCVCIGLCTIASHALLEITTKALEGQELQAVAWRWKWKDCGSWIVTEGEPDANERRIIEPLYKSAHVAEPVEYHIVFDGLPSPDGPRFIEVENAAGQSINAGEWRKRDDGLCELVIKAGAHAHG